ncbi:hypothetical protein ACLB1Q_13430 [Escherichia coli]
MVKTLVEAIILVFLVMYLFLQELSARRLDSDHCRTGAVCWGPLPSLPPLASR